MVEPMSKESRSQRGRGWREDGQRVRPLSLRTGRGSDPFLWSRPVSLVYFQNVPQEFQNIPQDLRNVPERLRNIPELLKNVPETSRNVLEVLRNVLERFR